MGVDPHHLGTIHLGNSLDCRPGKHRQWLAGGARFCDFVTCSRLFGGHYLRSGHPCLLGTGKLLYAETYGDLDAYVHLDRGLVAGIDFGADVCPFKIQYSKRRITIFLLD